MARELTPNQVVAHNLRIARTMRGWTQDEAGARLEQYSGERWSKVNFSAAERSAQGGRPRRFDADDLVSFAMCFGFPPMWFLLPPADVGAIRVARRSTRSMGKSEFVDLLRGSNGSSNAPLAKRSGGGLPQSTAVSHQTPRLERRTLSDLELLIGELTALVSDLRQTLDREIADRPERSEEEL